MNLLFLVFIFPLLSTILLIVFNNISKNFYANISILFLGISTIITNYIIYNIDTPIVKPFVQHLCNWINVGDFKIGFNLYVDGLSLTMIWIITGVGFLIQMFSYWYMVEDSKKNKGYSLNRYFIYVNLFIFSMLILVLADNLLLLFLGWECVGLCSYLLIGYYYKKKKNNWASFKAFIINRIIDIILAICLFLIWVQFGSLNIQYILIMANHIWTKCDILINFTTILLLGSAIGKSAQVPFQTWLADAMVGPTPVSALIHAATMVTAGVYIIARMHIFFELTPLILNLISIIGISTILIASISAIIQSNIKRILAYSTMSQLGYMFLAMGIKAWNVAIYHLMIHAFFKALLFLSVGSIIINCNHEQNIFKLNLQLLKNKLTYISFIFGSLALSAFPILSAGFYSKEEIIKISLINGHLLLCILAIIGTIFTSIYTFRMIFILFNIDLKLYKINLPNNLLHDFPLIILIILSTFMGAYITPPILGIFRTYNIVTSNTIIDKIFSIITYIILLILFKYIFYNKLFINKLLKFKFIIKIYFFLKKSLGFDYIYNKLFVNTYIILIKYNRKDWINKFINSLNIFLKKINVILTLFHNGNLRWYIFIFILSVIIFIKKATFI
ncbi:NADH-quinone oxidoreductase subunit L [Candidatus Johnevansia muelleri]|uniref:NADH-quinone oxidoreductase subunit L n=1 Tax=Candidatus Johnevansia muelleri TaxID=1495769 RepID=A0A078KED6_9GAMM|nr:NADH-quinone oxidoreductase subunit L [Candidatus Evansia muelleri]